MLKFVTSLAMGTGLLFMASAMAADDPVIGDERAVLQHLSLSQASQLPIKDLIAHGETLFRAKFTTLDGADRKSVV